MKSFKNFLVEKENPNNPSEEKPQISKSDAKKIQRMKDADPDTAKRIQAGLESSREAARRIKSGETRTSQTGQRTRTRPSTLGPDRIGGGEVDPSDQAQARQSGRVRTGGDPLKPDTRDKPQADTAKVTPEKKAELDKFRSTKPQQSPEPQRSSGGSGERRRADAMNQAKADGADKPFKSPRGRGSDLLDRLTGRTTRTRSSAKPTTAFGKPSGTDPKTGKAMYVPPKNIPQRDQRVDPKTGKATQAGVRNYAMSQGGYARSDRNMSKAEFDQVKARADQIASDPNSAEYKKIEKKINQEYGGRRMRRRPSNAPSFAQVKAEIDAKEAQKTKPQKSAKAVPPKPTPAPTPTPTPEQPKTPKKSYSEFSKFTQQNMRGDSRPKVVATPEPPAQPKAPKPEFKSKPTPTPTPTTTRSVGQSVAGGPVPSSPPSSPEKPKVVDGNNRFSDRSASAAADDLRKSGLGDKLGQDELLDRINQKPRTTKPKPTKPKLQLPPKLKGVGGTALRGAAGTAFGLGVGAGIEKLPVNRQTKDALQTTAGVIGAVSTPVASTLLSLGGSTRQAPTTQPSASDRATEFKSDPNKVNVRSFKPAYDPKNPYDITKWRLSNDPGVNTKMTKAELEKLTKPKFADLRGSIKPGSVVPKGFKTSDPELAKLNQKELDKLKPKPVKLPPGTDKGTSPKPEESPSVVNPGATPNTTTRTTNPTEPAPAPKTQPEPQLQPQPQPPKTQTKDPKPKNPQNPMLPPRPPGGRKPNIKTHTWYGPTKRKYLFGGPDKS